MENDTETEREPVLDRAEDASSMRVRNRRVSFTADVRLDQEMIEEVVENYGEDHVHRLVKSLVQRYVSENYAGMRADVAIENETPYVDETHFRVLVVA